MERFNFKAYEKMDKKELIEELEFLDNENEELREEISRLERALYEYKKKEKVEEYEWLFPTYKNLFKK